MNRDDFKSARRIHMRGTAGWYRITNAVTPGEPTRVDIYDEIGFWGVTAQEFVRDIGQVRGDLDLHINSPGGDVFDGLAIYNTLKQRRGQVAVTIDGLAASAASFIAQAASPGCLAIARTASMMIHNGFGLVIGDAGDMRQMADILDKQTENIASIYAERSARPTAEWQELMDAESWFIGPEAVDAGLADRVLNVDAAPIGNWDLSVFRNAPQDRGPRNSGGNAPPGTGDGHTQFSGRHEHAHPAYDGAGNSHTHDHNHDSDAVHRHDHGAEYATGTGQAGNAATVPYVSSWDTRHVPMTGTHRHDHAAMDAADHDDGIHSHDHDHAGDASHGHSHDGIGEGAAGDGGGATATAPGNSADPSWTDILPEWMRPANASYDDSDWDGNAAMTAASNSDNPASAFKAICAGRRDGPADERGSWALPHHKTSGAAANKNGVNNALARLSSTQGLTNKDAAESHLKAHQSAWGGGGDDDGPKGTGNTWQDAAQRVGTEMAELLRGHQPVADAPQGGE